MTNLPLDTDKDLSLLDFLIICAESWKLLFLGPLLTGLIATVCTFIVPKTYESTLTIRTDGELSSKIDLDLVLSLLIEKIELPENVSVIKDNLPKYLENNIKIEADSKSQHIKIVTKEKTHESAEKLAYAVGNVLETEFINSLGIDKSNAEQILNNERSINKLKEKLLILNKNLSKIGLIDPSLLEVAIDYYIELKVQVNIKELENIKLNNSRPRSWTEIKKISTQQLGLKSTSIVLLVMLMTFSTMIIYLLIRNAYYTLMSEPKASAKLMRVKELLKNKR